jgi:hypothetical protein
MRIAAGKAMPRGFRGAPDIAFRVAAEQPVLDDRLFAVLSR